MKIRLNEKDSLHLEPDFSLNVQLTNPMLNEQGSMSLPMSLPRTPHNLQLLGFPNRLDRVHKLRKKILVAVETGAMTKQAILEIMSSQGFDGIESVLLLNEATMYTNMQEVSMSAAFQIKKDASEYTVPGQTITDPMDRLIKYMELVMVGQLTEDFCLFPVATDYYTHSYTIGRPEQTREATVYNLLNEQMSAGGNVDPDSYTDTYFNAFYPCLRGRKAFKVKNGSNEFEVPKGYGITPFLRENFVLRQIFRYFGYKLEQSIFDTDPDLSRIVIINNTADAIVKGFVDYSQLVPSCTIHEYLETVRQKYGCEFFISEDHKTVTPVFWKDILNSKPKKDFSAKIKSEPIIEYSTPKQLKLCYKRDLEFSDLVVDTYEKFERDFGKIIGSYETFSYSYNPDEFGFYFIKNNATIYERYKNYRSDGTEIKSWRYVMRAMFDFCIEGEDTDYEEKTSNIVYTPQMNGEVLYSEGGGLYSSDFSITTRFLFIGNRRHMNTTLQETVTNDNGNSSTTNKEDDTGSCPIMAAFYFPTTFIYRGNTLNTCMGTMHRYDNYGNTIGNLDLTFGGDHGLYQHFWKEYNEVIKHSFHKAIYELDLNEADIAGYRMDELISVDGQALLPEKVEYISDKDRTEANRIEFRTVRLYEDIMD